MEEFPIVQRRLLFIQRNSENNANDAEVKHFVLNNIPPLAYAPNLPPHSFFIWDRLGRGGRCNNPS